MEGLDLLKKLDRVKAPDGFEQSVWVRLPQERRRRVRQGKVFHLAFAGSAAMFLVAVILTGFFVFRGGGEINYADNNAVFFPPGSNTSISGSGGAESLSFIPVLETMNYSAEVRNASYEPRTVYILEQVSEATPSEIKY